MKHPIATAAAFCVGFTLGSRTGRNQALRISSGPVARPIGVRVARVASTARAVVVLGAERARDAVAVGLGWRDADQATDALVIEMAGDLANALNGRRRAG